MSSCFLLWSYTACMLYVSTIWWCKKAKRNWYLKKFLEENYGIFTNYFWCHQCYSVDQKQIKVLFIYVVLHGNVSWTMLLLSTTRNRQRGLTCCFHNSSHDSEANMSLTEVLFLLLLLFVLILKAWHWQINNLSLGFQMSQQSLSSHADVSVGSDVCNSIRAQRERIHGLWPLARLCILSSLVRRDAKLQSLNAARPPGHLSAVAAVLCVHPRDMTQSSRKICPSD